MADTRTLQNLYDKILDEMQRPDLEAEMEKAVTQAIYFYQRTPFYQSDTTAAFTCVSGTNTVACPADLAWFRQIDIVVFNTRLVLIPRTWEYIDQEDSNVLSPTKGPPIEYATFNSSAANQGQNIRLFPTPDQNYTGTFDYVSLIPQPALPSTSNFWTTDAEAIVRMKAKEILYRDVVRNQEASEIFARAADEELVPLDEETAMRKWEGGQLRIRPVYF